MRGLGNSIKKPEINTKKLDHSNINFHIASNRPHINNLNNSNSNLNKDRKKTCSQDENKKSKGIILNFL